jgi:hypothetical protein
MEDDPLQISVNAIIINAKASLQLSYALLNFFLQLKTIHK